MYTVKKEPEAKVGKQIYAKLHCGENRCNRPVMNWSCKRS